MLVITGTQRSGTSTVAELIIEEGFDLHGMEPDEAGGHENLIVSSFYRNYLGDETFPFDDFPMPAPVDVPVVYFTHMEYPVIKFSFLLMNPAFITIWHKFRPKGDKFLIMRRNFGDVCRSKLRLWDRFRHDSSLLKQSAGMLEANWAASMTLLMRYEYETATVHFPGFVRGGEGELNEALRVLKTGIQVSDESFKRIIDPSKVHFG